jgi:hypothetical protein
MDWEILVFYPEPEARDKKHILASMIYFDSDMSKSTNTVIYSDWKTVIYIYVCGKCCTQFMLPMEKSVTFTGECDYTIDKSLICLQSERRRSC